MRDRIVQPVGRRPFGTVLQQPDLRSSELTICGGPMLEKQMKLSKKSGLFAVAAAAICIAASTPLRASGAASVTGSFWELPKDAGKLTLIIPGQAAPVITSVR